MKKLYLMIIVWLVLCSNVMAQSSGYLQFAMNIKSSNSNINPMPVNNSSNSILPSKSGITNANTNAIDATDVNIFPSSNPQAEVHISINKLFPSNVLASANTYTSSSNYNQGYYYTNNEGNSWQGSDVLPNSGLGFGDPSTCFDAQGNGYLVSMAPDSNNSAVDGYFVHKTNTQCTSWLTKTRGTGILPNFDKEMVTADNTPSSPYVNNFYSAWTDFSNPYSVKFNKSVDGTNTFSNPIILKNGFGQGTNVQTGPNGEVYVCWADYGNGTVPANGIGFAKSNDGGTSFITSVAFPYSGIRILGTNPLFNNIRVNDFPAMAVDKSCGTNRGKIYIVYPTKENGNGKAIIQVRSSSNNGSTWSTPITVSISTGLQSWLPWIAVDDTTGVVSVIYYCFDAASGFTTNTYVAYSFDGGISFSNLKVSDQSHITASIPGPFAPGYAGDYIGIASYGGKAYASWSDNRNGTWQAYVSKISYDVPINISSTNNINVNGPINYLSGTNSVNYNATSTIIVPATSSFSVQNGSNVIMNAGDKIVLKNGFYTKIGSKFLARISSVSSCSNSNKTSLINNENSISSKKEISLDKIICSPNPSNGIFKISLNEISEGKIQVTDLYGSTIYKSDFKNQNEFEMNMQDRPKGIYIVKVFSGEQVFTSKIIKN